MAAVSSSSSRKIKFHYGYGGEFTLCRNGGNLRYIGGTNKIMAVDRHITYTELIVKLWDTCKPSMSLWCMLPLKDYNYSLVHVTSDEELADVIEEYDRTGNKDLKIRAILDPLPPPIIQLFDEYYKNKVASCTPVHDDKKR